MTTSPSSLPRGDNRPTVLIDDRGQQQALGAELGRGGEGTVYYLRGPSDCVAKVYHRSNLSPETIAKLQSMVRRHSQIVSRIAAWPQSLLYDPGTREVRGLLMPVVLQSRRLHELYGTTSRRKHFPDARWQHLILAARNTAAAFAALHQEQVVVGDVNQGNLLVDDQMCVRFIDCDSFQVQEGDRTFRCPVGTPHFTPPELQSHNFASIVRSPDHDAFGLAVLIFHLLFMGRHPFVGRVRGDAEWSIEESISKRMFAFSRDRDALNIEPPPCSLGLEDVPESLAELFEKAFRRCGWKGQQRPTARQWAQELERLFKSCKRCDIDDTHVMYSGLRECPWCRIETEQGPSYFLPFNRSATLWHDRVREIELAIGQRAWTVFPDIPVQRLVEPALPQRIPRSQSYRFTGREFLCACAMFAFAMALFGLFTPWLSAVGSVMLILSCLGLLWTPVCRESRSKTARLKKDVQRLMMRMHQQAAKIRRDEPGRKSRFDRAFASLYDAFRQFHLEGDELHRLAAEYQQVTKDQQRTTFLQTQLIQDHLKAIPGLTPSTAATLSHYGIESAADIDSQMLYGIPNVSPSLQMNLLTWRDSMMESYRSRHVRSQVPLDTKSQRDLAVQNYRMAKAEEVLAVAKVTRKVSQDVHEAVAADLHVFDITVQQWKAAARALMQQLGQQGWLERIVNQGMMLVTAMLIGAGLLALAIFRWIQS